MGCNSTWSKLDMTSKTEKASLVLSLTATIASILGFISVIIDASFLLNNWVQIFILVLSILVVIVFILSVLKRRKNNK